MVMSVFIAVLFSMPVLAAYSTGLPWLFVVVVVLTATVQVAIVSSRTGAERVIFQIAILAQILAAATTIRDWLGLTFWAGLPIHFVAMALVYVLAVLLPTCIKPYSSGIRCL
jgi:hypothetical protein